MKWYFFSEISLLFKTNLRLTFILKNHINLVNINHESNLWILLLNDAKDIFCWGGVAHQHNLCPLLLVRSEKVNDVFFIYNIYAQHYNPGIFLAISYTENCISSISGKHLSYNLSFDFCLVSSTLYL